MFDHPRFGTKGRMQFWTAAMLTHGLVSVCADSEAYLQGRFFLPGKKLFVVENGINLTPFLAVPPRKPGNEMVFGFVGRMAREKNHRILIEAFALAHRKHSHIRLRLLGDGVLEPTLKEQVHSLGLDEVVEFCGFSHDVAGFLSGLDVFILPSSFEALPLSLIEAIASGLPVVATAVGGVPAVVQNTDSGWLSEPNDAQALLSAMESAITSSDLRARGERARNLVVKYYSAERMASDYERLYQTLVHIPSRD
jgi:glycosyltransferase involved in cell wall biosynthesis